LLTRPDWTQRLRSVLHVLYLIFNEGYASSTGDGCIAQTCPANRVTQAAGNCRASRRGAARQFDTYPDVRRSE